MQFLIKTSYIYLAFKIVFSLNVIAQIQDTTIIPVLDPNRGYDFRENRFEGFYISKVATSELKVVNLTYGMLNYSLEKSEVIQVSYPHNHPYDIYVRAQAIPLKTYYQMDATLQNQEVLKWSVKDVLLPYKLRNTDVGIVGWFDQGSYKIYVPLITTSKRTANTEDNDIHIIVRPSVDLNRVNYVWNSQNGKNNEIKTIEGIIFAGNPIYISPPIYLDGLHQLVVKASVHGAKNQSLSLFDAYFQFNEFEISKD